MGPGARRADRRRSTHLRPFLIRAARHIDPANSSASAVPIPLSTRRPLDWALARQVHVGWEPPTKVRQDHSTEDWALPQSSVSRETAGARRSRDWADPFSIDE